MAKIVIKKRISLDFLGEEYKGGYVEFKSLSIKDVQGKLDEITNVGEDNKKAVEMMLKLLSDCFVGGKFVSGETTEDIVKEDLEDFDVASIIKFFQILSGQDGDLKA